MTANESHRVPEQRDAPPDELPEDPGLRAIAEYRLWRRRHLGLATAPKIPSLLDLLASMREEPGDDGEE